MKQNKYNDKNFFDKYSKMERSIGGLESAGEWHILKTMLPDFNEKNVLDIGCGFGWHCRYESSEGAKSVLGIDISSEMLKVAKEKTNDDKIKYKCIAMEDIDFSKGEFDVVISSLAFHYTKDFDIICKKYMTAYLIKEVLYFQLSTLYLQQKKLKIGVMEKIMKYYIGQ